MISILTNKKNDESIKIFFLSVKKMINCLSITQNYLLQEDQI